MKSRTWVWKTYLELVMSDNISKYNNRTFESIKKIDPESDEEYWEARELAPVLGYLRWENFENVITKAAMSMVNAGTDVSRNFREVTKMVEVGSNAIRPTKDIFLSRHACYVIAMNGDPSKEEIAAAQAYFAHQTRRQELNEIESKDKKRLEARHKLSESDKVLSSVSINRGVSGPELANIKSQGDKRLFGGNNTRMMKQKYGVADNKPLADHLPTVSLTAKQLANEMTAVNAESKDLHGFGGIGMEHVSNNIEIRKSLIARGIVLENLPAEEDVKKVERRIKSADKKLGLNKNNE